MDWNISHSFDLSSGHPTPTYLSNVLAEVGDNLSHNWSVVVTENGQPVNLNGATVVGYFIRADGGKVPVNGEAQGCVATVIPEAACFAIAGMLKCVMKITLDGATMTIDAFMINVRGDLTDVVVDPGDVVPDLQSLLNAIDDMEEATAAAEAAAEIAMPSIEYMGMANLSGINWTLRKNISNGQETNSQYTALSGFIPAAPTYTRTGADTDSNNVPLSMFVHEYDSTQTWLRRTAINASAGKTMHPQNDCVYVRIVFGRASSSGVEISQSDIDDYFGIDTLVAVQDEIADTRKDVTELKSAVGIDSYFDFGEWRNGWIRPGGTGDAAGSIGSATKHLIAGYNGSQIVQKGDGRTWKISVKNGWALINIGEYTTKTASSFTQFLDLSTNEVTLLADKYYCVDISKASNEAISPTDVTADTIVFTHTDYTDKTLTLSDKAADAKVVGDRMRELDSIGAQVLYTAMMTDTLLEGGD